jgi:hypothetical protein
MAVRMTINSRCPRLEDSTSRKEKRRKDSSKNSTRTRLLTEGIARVVEKTPQEASPPPTYSLFGWKFLGRLCAHHALGQLSTTPPVSTNFSERTRACIPNRVSEVWIKIFKNFRQFQLPDCTIKIPSWSQVLIVGSLE